MQRTESKLNYIGESLLVLKEISFEGSQEEILLSEFREQLLRSKRVLETDGGVDYISVHFSDILDYMERWDVIYLEEGNLFINQENLLLKLKLWNLL